MQLEPIDLGQLLSQITEDARGLMARYGTITLVYPDQPIWAMIDALRLDRAIGNLLSYAAKNMRRGGSVQLTLASHAGQVKRPAASLLPLV